MTDKIKQLREELEEMEKNHGWIPEHKEVVMDFWISKMIAREEEILEEYTKFLCDHNYTDSDVWAEEPTAIKRFLTKE